MAPLLWDRPELLAFFQCPRVLWRKLWTTSVIERRFVEVQGRTRPMVYFVSVRSMERIIFSIFSRFKPGAAPAHPSPIYTSSVTSPGAGLLLTTMLFRGPLETVLKAASAQKAANRDFSILLITA